MAKVSTVLDSVRTLLNDENGINWQDYRLIPKLQIAFREMVARLDRAGIPVLLAQTVVLSVPAYTPDDLNQDLSTVTSYPTDMIEPIWLKERQVGQLDEDFIDMTRTDALPNVQKDTTLIWWSWQGQTVLVRGATIPVQVQLRYRKNLTAPLTVNDDCIVALAETFLVPRTVQHTCNSVRDWDRLNVCKADADEALDTMLGIEVGGMQDLPARRRPYHRGRASGRVS